jgi:hypothetical protein
MIRLAKLRKQQWEVYVGRTGTGQAHRILVGKLYGKRPFERSRNIYDNNINTDLKEIDFDVGGGCIRLSVVSNGGLWFFFGCC